MKFILAALALALGAPQVSAQAQQQQARPPARTYSQADLWERAGDRITFALAGISVPVAPGATRLDRTVEASREGRGLDNALLYLSADGQVFATVYIYAPALADPALTSYMTDYAIHLTSGPALRTLRTAVVAVGGREGVAIRFDYAGARQERLASSAAFMRIGRWIVKLRVSGPEARRAEVETAMNALLQGLRFEGQVQPGRVAPLSPQDCRHTPTRAARLVISTDAETAEDAILAHNLAGEVPTGGQGDEPGAAPNQPRWCKSAGYSIPNSYGPTPVLRDETAGGGDDSRRSVAVALWGDNGTMVEVVERRSRDRTRFVVLHHQIGQTTILGAFASAPTDAQLRAIATGEDREASRPRASIVNQASGDSSVNLQVAPATPTT